MPVTQQVKFIVENVNMPPHMAWVRSLNGFPEREVNSILKVHYLYPSAISLYSNPTPPAPSAATSSGYPLQHS